MLSQFTELVGYYNQTGGLKAYAVTADSGKFPYITLPPENAPFVVRGTPIPHTEKGAYYMPPPKKQAF
eukprot:CAMPEP_0175850266 /NCGR_PEP_ID=MMETSP0107_2-20121207/24993_1 /TAXON_ID=195067 ORGANISM="Goniomonas pacifica, Strain CCMP1869" /NCGR_SAMPLE_ID=MMETSP0107_2 /ASSEMBLY_ACC=CAM_ASM_000203 /LENGTH=67 /DNA_ID=CAMNT_0017165533 /DNA_START=76 /DNA_END=279 /DNA_ORIENTATION=-